MLDAMPLVKLAEVRAGGGAPQDPNAFGDVGHPFVRAGSLSRLLAGASEADLEKIQPATAEAHGLKLFPADTVLFAKSGMSAMKGLVYRLKRPAYVVNHLAALVPRHRNDGAFLARALEFFSPTRIIQDVAYPSIRLSDIEVMEVGAPKSQEERSRIAAILDEADALRAKRRAALAQLDEMERAIFVEMFGVDSRTVAWPTEDLGDLCDLVRGSSPRPQGDPKYFGGPVPRLMIADITRDGMFVTPQIDSLTLEGAKRSRPMQAGSVVMAVSGAVGLPAILAVDACIHDGFVGFRALSPRVSAVFLYFCLQHERAENGARGTGAIWVNLTTDQVSRFRIPVPPRNLQYEFEARLADLGALSSKLRDGLKQTELLFASLQHRAFRGEL